MTATTPKTSSSQNDLSTLMRELLESDTVSKLADHPDMPKQQKEVIKAMMLASNAGTAGGGGFYGGRGDAARMRGMEDIIDEGGPANASAPEPAPAPTPETKKDTSVLDGLLNVIRNSITGEKQ